jgi:hypothetical protein
MSSGYGLGHILGVILVAAIEVFVIAFAALYIPSVLSGG